MQTIGSTRAFRVAVARDLIAFRKRVGLSQTVLAAELGIDQSTVSKVEAGNRALSLDEIFCWFEGLGVDPVDGARALAMRWQQVGARRKGYWEENVDDQE